MKYEHTVLNLHKMISDAQIVERLYDHSEVGWELCGVVEREHTDGVKYLAFFLKRLIRS